MTLSYKVGDDDLLSSAKFSIEVCVQEINNWMILNGLKLKMRRKLSCFHPVLNWNLFALEVKQFNRYGRPH